MCKHILNIIFLFLFALSHLSCKLSLETNTYYKNLEPKIKPQPLRENLILLASKEKTLIVIVMDATLKHQVGRGGPNSNCVSLSHAR